MANTAFANGTRKSGWAKLLGDFRDANSRVAIEVCDLPSEQLLELLAGQQLDAVLTIFSMTAPQNSRVGFFSKTHMYWPFPQLIASRSETA
jgi:hypothetical protein